MYLGRHFLRGVLGETLRFRSPPGGSGKKPMVKGGRLGGGWRNIFLCFHPDFFGEIMIQFDGGIIFSNGSVKNHQLAM